MPRCINQHLRQGECLLSLVVLAAIFAGCTSVVDKVHPKFSQRLETITSVTVLPPNVAVYETAANSLSYFASEKSETAQANLADALAQGFLLAERFTLRGIDLSQSPAAVEDFKTLRPHGSEWDEASPCLPTPTLALRELVDADAFLITRALEIDKEQGAPTKDILRFAAGSFLSPSGVIAAPALLVGTLISKRFRQRVYAAGLTAVQVCLVNTRTGDELWSYLHELSGRDSLQDPVIVRSVVDEAFKSFQSGFAK